MVVAQLVEWPLPIPEVRGSNPVIGKIYIEHCLLSTVLKRRKQRKRGREWPIIKIKLSYLKRYGLTQLEDLRVHNKDL